MQRWNQCGLPIPPTGYNAEPRSSSSGTPTRRPVMRTPPSGSFSSRRLATLQGCANLSSAETEILVQDSPVLGESSRPYRRYLSPSGIEVIRELSPITVRGVQSHHRYFSTPPTRATRGPSRATSVRAEQMRGSNWQPCPLNQETNQHSYPPVVHTAYPSVVNIGCRITNNYFAAPSAPNHDQR